MGSRFRRAVASVGMVKLTLLQSSDYVPFYFTPFSPMMYNIKTGWGGIRQRNNDEIVIMVSSLERCRQRRFRSCLRIGMRTLSPHSSIRILRDWIRSTGTCFSDEISATTRDDPSKKERYQAEALVHKHLPVDALSGLVCYNDDVLKSLNAALAKRKQTIKVVKKPGWYF